MKLYIACMREDKIHYLINNNLTSVELRFVLRPPPLVFDHPQWKV